MYSGLFIYICRRFNWDQFVYVHVILKYAEFHKKWPFPDGRGHRQVASFCSSCVAMTFKCVYKCAAWHYSWGRCVPRPCMISRKMGSDRTARFWEKSQRKHQCAATKALAGADVSSSQLSVWVFLINRRIVHPLTIRFWGESNTFQKKRVFIFSFYGVISHFHGSAW